MATCESKICEKEAAYEVYWPGQTIKQCLECLNTSKTLATVMGFKIAYAPIQPTKELATLDNAKQYYKKLMTLCSDLIKIWHEGDVRVIQTGFSEINWVDNDEATDKLNGLLSQINEHLHNFKKV